MPTIYFIRHGEAEHNIGASIYGDAAYDMPKYWNPSLTDKGEQEAQTLQTMIDLHDKPIIVSPLQRALETAAIGFPGSTFIIDDRVSEFNPAWRCNRRIDTATLRDEWSQHILACHERTPIAEETKDQLRQRVKTFMESVVEDTVVVSHHDFIRAALDILGTECVRIHHCLPVIVQV